MRIGNLSVRLISADRTPMVETATGHILAHDGQVYSIVITNHGRRRMVARIQIDGKRITDRGIVLNPYQTIHLERPTTESETGRFTVCKEGNEFAFGPDGGRENASLGLVEVLGQEEILDFAPWTSWPVQPMIWSSGVLGSGGNSGLYDPADSAIVPSPSPAYRYNPSMVSFAAASTPMDSVAIRSAAGTALTGNSSQRFQEVAVGILSEEVTRIALRIVIGDARPVLPVRPLPSLADRTPSRPSPRP